jgi:hypothetical protein
MLTFCSSAASKWDLPIPGSPASNTTRPSPVLAVSHRRSNNSSSSARPTRESRPPRSASKRLSIVLSPTTLHARSGARNPFGSEKTISRYSKRSPVRTRVDSEITTAPGSAAVCRRAARLRVSPTALNDEPDLVRSPMTTTPLAIPTRVRSVPGGPAIVSSRPTPSTMLKPARIACSALASCACG